MSFQILKHMQITVLLIVVFSACEDDRQIDTSKSTFYDDICDITFFNGYYYSTNYDLSGNAGSQIDLLQFTSNNDNISLTDHFDLDLNGQSFLTITNDNDNLYLQSMGTHLIFGISPIGERIFVTSDTISNNWRPSGIAYIEEIDSLAVLYRNYHSPTMYRMRVLSKSIHETASRDIQFQLTNVDTGYHGVYAMSYNNSQFFFLGVNQSEQDILLKTTWAFNILETDTIADSTVVGLCFKDNELYLGYRDKRIEKFN